MVEGRVWRRKTAHITAARKQRAKERGREGDVLQLLASHLATAPHDSVTFQKPHLYVPEALEGCADVNHNDMKWTEHGILNATFNPSL